MTDKILFEEMPVGDNKRLGVITLNDPRTINALSLEMIRVLYPRLLSWQKDDDLVALFIHSSSERGLCSGGNIKQLYDSMTGENSDTPNQLALDFFSEEYQLDQLIHGYKKPIIVWGHGIVMGGGVGLMVGASHRVVTAESTLAMPEIGIGLFPDVGASWFLNRMPDSCGLFLGLTGASITGSDALFTGLADHLLENSGKNKVLEQLTQSNWTPGNDANHEVVTAILANIEFSTTLPKGPLETHAALIQQLIEGKALLAIANELQESESIQPDVAGEYGEWWRQAITNLKNGCPTTAHLVYQQLHRSIDMSLAQIFEMELNIAMQCVAHPDFREGVRALLIDKDRNPRWRHNSIADVPDQWISEHFQPY